MDNAAIPEAAPASEVESLRQAVVAQLTYTVGKDPEMATQRDWFIATAYAVRDRMVDQWIPSNRSTRQNGAKQVHYLSLEFLIGRLLFDSLTNMGLIAPMREALSGLGVDLDALQDLEPDAALGNGGLGRLAACFMESMATLAVPAYGYGIRYNHGLFRQQIKNGWQQEFPETWLTFGNPWEFARPEVNYQIGFGGSVEQGEGAAPAVWTPSETIDAIAYDIPVPGWRGKHVNTLRLWTARAADPLRLDAFNRGDHVGAVANRSRANAISQVLYPSDETPEGQELRLRQEYFFSSASLQDLIARHVHTHGDVRTLAEFNSIQLNDTHPAIAIAELMRLLIDVFSLSWQEAWRITTSTFSYTNHTLLPEALETWPVHLMERLLPRHMQIIYLMNAIHLDTLRKRGKDEWALMASVSLIDEGGGRRVRMGNLAFLGSHRVNGVSALHSELIKQSVFHDFHTLYPDRITNVTNGITFRRWLFESNPGLTECLVDVIGPEIMDNAMALKKLEAHANDTGLHERLRLIRRGNKAELGRVISQTIGVKVDPDALFDVQIKRMHEYKRQLLNILETVALYDAMRAQPHLNWQPRVKIFAGKAAASYHRAKQIIKLIHDVAKVVNNDPSLRGALKVVFLPNYNVSLAQKIIPASDLSEQISTAGMEASGTGNMKLSLNGALTIGTLDGANVEIRDHVGDDNIFIFGLTTEEVAASRAVGINAEATIAASPNLKGVLEAIRSGVFSPDEPTRYQDLVDAITYHDHFLVCADFDSYYSRQRDVAACWRNPEEFWRKSIINTANMGWFSSDRSITDYGERVWKLNRKPHHQA